MKVLVTSTSFQDNAGKHRQLLDSLGYEISYARGPLNEEEISEHVAKYDAIICGDDEYTKTVLKKGKNASLKILSKYGVGLDKIDLIAAKELEISVTNCPGVNQRAVAEHVIALLFSHAKNLYNSFNTTNNQSWVRETGYELNEKSLGIIGLGNIGREVASLAINLGMKVIAFDKYIDVDFAKANKIEVASSLNEIAEKADFITLHVNLNESTKHIVNNDLISLMKDTILINTARAGLVSEDSILSGLEKGNIKAYLTDVLDIEPISELCKIHNHPNVFITPHIGSRTSENVVRQGVMAVENLIKEVNNANN